MKRLLFVLVVLAVVTTSVRPASAQMVVSDPYLEQMETTKWYHDFSNAYHLAETDIQTAQQLRQSIAQYRELYNQYHHGFPSQIWRQASSEIADLAKVTEAGYSISAYDANGSAQLAKVFPEDTSAYTPAQLDALWSSHMQSALKTAVQATNLRMQQMDTEESQIAALRGMANNSGLTQMQMLQSGLMIADQQLEELRAIERVLLQHFTNEYQQAYKDASAGGHEGVLKAFQEQALEQFYTGPAHGMASSTKKTMQGGLTPAIPQKR